MFTSVLNTSLTALADEIVRDSPPHTVFIAPRHADFIFDDDLEYPKLSENSPARRWLDHNTEGWKHCHVLKKSAGKTVVKFQNAITFASEESANLFRLRYSEVEANGEAIVRVIHSTFEWKRAEIKA